MGSDNFLRVFGCFILVGNNFYKLEAVSRFLMAIDFMPSLFGFFMVADAF